MPWTMFSAVRGAGAGEVVEASGAGGVEEFVDGGDAEFVVDEGGLLGTDGRDRHDLADARRHLGAQRVDGGDPAGAQVLGDLLSGGPPDAGDGPEDLGVEPGEVLRVAPTDRVAFS